MKKYLIPFLVLPLFLTACGPTEEGTSSQKPIGGPTSSLALEGPAYFEVGVSSSLTSVYDEGADVALEYSSSNPLIARIDEEGKVTPLSVGEVVFSVVDGKSGLYDELNATVVSALPSFSNKDEIVSFINGGTATESKVGEIKYTKKSSSTYYKGQSEITISHYDDNSILRETVETKEGEETTTTREYRSYVEDKFYDVTVGAYQYAAIYEVVDGFPGAYQYSKERALSLSNSFNVFSSTAGELTSAYDDKQEITKVEKDPVTGTVTIEGTFYRMFRWIGDPSQGDYATYELSMEAGYDGMLRKFSLNETLYTSDSYDFDLGQLKDTAKVDSSSSVEMEVTNFSPLSAELDTMDVNAYFVSSYEEVVYGEDNTVHVGDILSTLEIKVLAYLPETALDAESFTVESVTNTPGQIQFELNSYGYYQAIATGEATLTIVNDNNPDVKATITITVI